MKRWGQARRVVEKFLTRLDTVSVIAVALALMAWLTIALAESHNSPTCDEYRHVTRGVAALRAPDTRINRPHPPLGQALAMLPVALTTNPHFERLPGWDTGSLAHVNSSYIQRDYARGRGYLRQGRLMNAAWSSAFLLFLVAWLRRHFGSVTALSAGALYATCPVVLAHAGLVTNDFAVAAFALLSLAAVLSYLEHGQWWRLGLAALAVAALPVAKVSGIVVLGIVALIPLWWLIRRRGVYADPRFARAVLTLLRDYVLIALFVLLGINAIYRFDNSFLTPRQLALVSYVNPELIRSASAAEQPYPVPFLSNWPSSWRVPLPLNFLRSVAVIANKNEHGDAGRWFGARGSSVLYFPFMLLGKPQALLLPLLVAGFVLDARAMVRGIGKWLLFLALAFLAVAMSSSINIGVRHVLLVVICLLGLGGRAAAVVLRFAERRIPRLRLALVVLAAGSLLGGVLWAFPAFIGDFNVWIGNRLGREAGALAEDWGQDGAALAAELHRRGIRRVAYAPRHSFGVADLANSGLSVKRVGCKVRPGALPIAVHLAEWQRSRSCYRALRKYTPDLVVNDNVLVFLPLGAEDASTKHRRRRSSPPIPASPAGAAGEQADVQPDELDDEK